MLRMWIVGLVAWVGTLVVAADIQGKLVNGTKGGPGSAESVQLILLKDQMTVLDSKTSITGDFTLSTTTDLTGQRLLIQVNKDGVLYTQPFEWPVAEALSITVYDTATEAKLETSIGNMAFYAYAQSMDIGTFYNINNVSHPPVTLYQPEGSFHFQLIPGHSDVEASTRRGTMPLRQQLKIEGDKASMSYSLRPGTTQLMVRSKHLYNPRETNSYKLVLPEGQKGMQVLALPKTLELEAEGLVFVADDPKEDMRLYEFTPAPGQKEVTIRVKGKPLDKPVAANATESSSQATGDAHGADGHEDKVENRPNFLDAYRWYIVGSILGVLSLLSLLALKR